MKVDPITAEFKLIVCVKHFKRGASYGGIDFLTSDNLVPTP